MSLQKSLLGFGVLFFLAIAIFVYSSFPEMVRAAASVFNRTNCVTNTATSSPAYMSAGLGTTTVSCFLGGDGADTATVSVEVNASSTLSQYAIFVEESMDGQDWFPVSINQSATTTTYGAGAINSTLYRFASSTIGQTGLGLSLNRFGVDGTDNRNHFVFSTPVRMRYLRAIGTMNVATGTIWMQILPKATL